MRALVSIFAGLLILISLYQLSFTWFVNKHEKELDAKAVQLVKRNHPTGLDKEAQDERKTHYWDSLSAATKDKEITWWGQTYQKAKESELLLGLDLQGGISVTLDVALDGLIRGLSNNPGDPALLKGIADAQARKTTSDKNFIDLFAESFTSVNSGQQLAPLFANTQRNTLSVTASNSQVISWIHEQGNAAMAQTFQVLRKRIDQFGVAQPNISLDENKGIITVELAGAKDPERVRKILQMTANLQFWEVYRYDELVNGLVTANQTLAQIQKGTQPDSLNANNPDSAKQDTTAAGNPLFSVLGIAQPQQDQATGKPIYQPYIGYARIQDTAIINRYLSTPAVKNKFPANLKFLWGKQERNETGGLVPTLTLYAIKTIPGKEGAYLEGDAIEDARQDFDQITNEVNVSMKMNTPGTKRWAKMTGDNVNRPIAITLDDIVYTAPNVIQKIDGGDSRITMGSSKNQQLMIQEAQDIANILKAGKLKARPVIVHEEVVGGSIGEAAAEGGMWAFIISFGVIFLLMLIYYNTGGIVANIALILNLLFTVGVLSALNATLTAPGIAGLVLTIGMAVDTNVIIFERIKDELARGSNHAQAIKLGYSRSLPPVLDAHITTLLTAIILFIYGLGPVLGFATTQILGILLSLFCGILVSRLITDWYTKKDRHLKYFTPISKRIFRHANYNFIKYRKYAYMITALVVLAGVGAIFNGFDQGVEFEGGRSYIVNFQKSVDEEQVRQALDKNFEGSLIIKTYGSANKLDITTDYRIAEQGPIVDSAVRNKLFEGLKSFLPAGLTAEEFATTKYVEAAKKVDPTISDDLKSGAQWATFWSLLIIAIYIFIRFRDWRYSVGTIVALLHDVLVTLAVFSYFRNVVPFPLEIDQHFIAAILTVIGFSMNDTVVVYDRIREHVRNTKNTDKATLINKAINETLSRTIMTSLTVFLTVLILFLVGGEVTRGFAFAMLIGVITGCYSSIFVAAPILVDFAKNKPLGEADTTKEIGKVPGKKPVVLAKKA